MSFRAIVLSGTAVLLFAQSAHALIGGNSLTGSPDVVRIIFENGWICSSAFIDATTILTAAHCVTPPTASEPLRVSRIETIDEREVAVRVQALIRNPKYNGQQWPAYDIGVVKTSPYSDFKGQFHFQEVNVPAFGEAALFGCGRTDVSTKALARTTGTNHFFRIGSILFFVGQTAVAPNDSGGPVTEAQGRVVAVATTTTDSMFRHLPILSTATSIQSDSNREFLKSHLGPNQKQ